MLPILKVYTDCGPPGSFQLRTADRKGEFIGFIDNEATAERLAHLSNAYMPHVTALMDAAAVLRAADDGSHHPYVQRRLLESLEVINRLLSNHEEFMLSQPK